MKEAKQSQSRAGADPPKWHHRGSVSSHRSARSSHSQESHRSRARPPRRVRRFSLSSLHSQAISVHSSSSIGTNAHSRKTSHADDSDASDTNESLGETEEDVWFPTEGRDSGDIHVDELDQLLNLSEEEALENEDEAQISFSGPSSTPRPFSVGTIIPQETEPSPQPPASPRKQFVEYTAAFDPQYPGTSSSSGDSEQKLDAPLVDSAPPLPESPMPADRLDTLERLPGGNRPLVSDVRSDAPRFGAVLQSLRKRPSDVQLREDDQQSQRYSFFAPGLENTVHAPDLASLVGESNSFSSLFNPANGTWFLDCFRPTDVEMKALSRAFGIHPLTTEDIQTEDAREKYESFKNYYLVVYHTFENDRDDENYMKAINFYVLVFKEGVISFHFEPVSHCRNVRRRMRQLRDYINFTPDWVAYALIDDITDSFAPEIQSVEEEADFIEDAVYLDHDGEIEMHDLLRRLGEGRRHTMHLLRMLSGKADVVRGFAKRVNERDMPSEMNLYLGDIQDHIVTMYQNLSAYEKIFSRTHFNYMGLLQMEFVDSSNRMTGVLGKVTILGTVLVPMNLITGLFGMNVKVPGQDAENLHWFFGILGLVLFLIVTLLLGSTLYMKLAVNRRNPRRTQ